MGDGPAGTTAEASEDRDGKLSLLGIFLKVQGVVSGLGEKTFPHYIWDMVGKLIPGDLEAHEIVKMTVSVFHTAYY